MDLAGNYGLGKGWGANGHFGHLKFKGMSNADYTDWKIGVTKDINGWVLGAAYLDTNAKGNCSAPAEFYCFGNTRGMESKDAGKARGWLWLSKSFYKRFGPGGRGRRDQGEREEMRYGNNQAVQA